MRGTRAQSTRLPALLALGFAVMFLSSAIKGIYQAYFADLASSFALSRGAFALSGAVFMLTVGLASPLAGWLSDRFGPLRTIFGGSVTAGLALCMAGWLHHDFGVFVLSYGVLAAIALAAMTYVPMGVLVDRGFADHDKGLAYAIVTNGTSIGFIVLAPLWLWARTRVDWITVSLAVGLIFLLPISFWLWRVARCERQDAMAAIARPAYLVADMPGSIEAALGFLKDPRFFVLGASFMACGASMAFVDVHLVPYWQDASVPTAVMGSSLSLLGLLELVSGVAAGWMAGRLPKNRLLAGFYTLRCVALLLLLTPAAAGYTYGFAVLFGLSYLGTVILTSMYCLELYGRRIKGQAFGVLFLLHQIAAFATVKWGAMSYDSTGNYIRTVECLCGLTLVAGALAVTCLPKIVPAAAPVPLETP